MSAAREMIHRLGYEKHSVEGCGRGNSRYGNTLKGKRGEDRGRNSIRQGGEFEPQLIKKHQRRFDGFDEKINSLYARGMTTRKFKGIWKRSMVWKSRRG